MHESVTRYGSHPIPESTGSPAELDLVRRSSGETSFFAGPPARRPKGTSGPTALRPVLAALVTLLLANSVAAGDRLDELFASWEKAQAGFQSLVIEFTLKELDTITSHEEARAGTLRLLRTPAGDLYGSYQVDEPRRAVGNPRRVSGLLSGGTVYLLDHDKKSASVVGPGTDTLPDFLETYFNPLVVLLDRKQAEAKYAIDLVKQDEWYTYLILRRKQPRRSGWLTPQWGDLRLTVVNKPTPTIAADMPRQLSHSPSAGYVITFDITAWRLNTPDGPTVADFAKPQDRPGWQVVGPLVAPPRK